MTVVGTCRWTGYDFPIINIGTGYLNWPNSLLACYSVYHRVASQPRFPAHNVNDRPAISAPATVRVGRNIFRVFHFFLLLNNNRAGYPRCAILPQGMHMRVFSKVYCDRVPFLCAERLETGSGIDPPPPPPRAEWTKPIQKYTTFTVFFYIKTTQKRPKGGGGEMRHFCQFHHEFHNTTPLTRNTFVECYFLSSPGGGGGGGGMSHWGLYIIRVIKNA